MILTLEDDGCVHLYTSLDEVVIEIEALDAEECLRAVFDDRGQRYVIDWIEPNTRGRVGVTNGRYRLIVSGDPDPQALTVMLDETGKRGLTDDEASSVAAVRRRLGTGA